MKTYSPKSMQNSIWSRPEFKFTKNHWEFRGRQNPQRKANIVNIGFCSKKGKQYHFKGDTFDTFDDVKQAAADQGIHEVRMGAIKAKIAIIA